MTDDKGWSDAETLHKLWIPDNPDGSGWADVVRTRIILIDIDDWKKVIDVRARYCRESKPVDTIMQINRFVNPEWLVEIEVDAVVSGE